MHGVEVIRSGGERVRTGPWRGDREVAYLTPVPDAPAPSATFVRHCLDELARRGIRRVVTGALGPGEQEGFLGAGFAVEERLHLLAHPMTSIPDVSDPPGISLRRAVPRDRAAVLAVDSLAFEPFWRLDEHGLDDAVGATPHARFRAADGAGTVVGYAVTGRSGRRGFVQRLAVDPARQGNGIGRVLLVDALRWLRRWRVERTVVNTQLGNTAALSLYERCGFHREPSGLCVLSTGLDG